MQLYVSLNPDDFGNLSSLESCASDVYQSLNFNKNLTSFRHGSHMSVYNDAMDLKNYANKLYIYDVFDCSVCTTSQPTGQIIAEPFSWPYLHSSSNQLYNWFDKPAVRWVVPYKWGVSHSARIFICCLLCRPRPQQKA